MHLSNARNGPAFDLPAPMGSGRTWILAATPRSGSTLLCRLLWDAGLGAPLEYLNPRDVRDWEARLAPSALARLGHRLLVGPAARLAGARRWDERRLAAYLERVRARRTGASGWFGMKLHHHHFQRWFGADPGSCARVLRPRRWLVIERRDRVAQAVSWALALQTGRWTAGGPARPALYSRRLVDALLARIDAHERGWSRTFAALGARPLRLTYEELCADPVGAVRSVLAFLGEHDRVPEGILALPLRRQADPRNARWIARHRAAATGLS